jgi:thiosulfate/3-mercaptopyruvate sulfurtransferase
MTSEHDGTTLVSADALARWIDDANLVVVDARFVLAGANPDAGEAAWRAARIPGARYVHLDRDLSDHSRPAGEGRHPLPDEDRFRALLGRLGIGAQTQVVVYDAGDAAMAAARFWWLLRLLGHRQVAVLDGGFARWRALGLPLASDDAGAADVREQDAGTRAQVLALETAAQARTTAAYPGRFDRSAIAGSDEIEARLADAPGWLLDARAPERFRGDIEPLDVVAGHIPGARNRPYAANLVDGRFRAPEDLRADFERLLAGRAAHEVVLSCGSGVTACHNLLAMEYAGLPGARIYAPSWSGWITDRLRPVAKGD